MHGHAYSTFLHVVPAMFLLIFAHWSIIMCISDENIVASGVAGVMCVAITPNLLMAAVVSNSLYLLINLFSGFVIPRPVRGFLLALQIVTHVTVAQLTPASQSQPGLTTHLSD